MSKYATRNNVNDFSDINHEARYITKEVVAKSAVERIQTIINVSIRAKKYIPYEIGYVIYRLRTPCSLISSTVIEIPINPVFASKNTILIGITVSIPRTVGPYCVCSVPNAPPNTMVNTIGSRIIKNRETYSREIARISILKYGFKVFISTVPPFHSLSFLSYKSKYLPDQNHVM